MSNDTRRYRYEHKNPLECAVEAPTTASSDAIKASNPKDAIGVTKVPFSTIPSGVMAEVGLALYEGARKYGRHNYRAVGVRASVYYDATMRHMTAWWEGQDLDPDSGLSHITKAIASLVVLRDAMRQNKLSDDRPPPEPSDWQAPQNAHVKTLIAKYPEAKEPFTAEPKGIRAPGAFADPVTVCTCPAGSPIHAQQCPALIEAMRVSK